ncbi:hypothetical protein BT69DRAFT_1346465 [Atractiella rhizophila]|nr:hypothetical protein BT69DRAFT_1346465 [Atractiella rhizophila]
MDPLNASDCSGSRTPSPLPSPSLTQRRRTVIVDVEERQDGDMKGKWKGKEREREDILGGGLMEGLIERKNSLNGNGKGKEKVVVHKVTPADSLASLSLKYGIAPSIIRKYNRLWVQDSVQTKEVIYIPVHLSKVAANLLLKPPELERRRSGMTESDADPPTPSSSASELPETEENSHVTISTVPTSELSFFPPPSAPRLTASPRVSTSSSASSYHTWNNGSSSRRASPYFLVSDESSRTSLDQPRETGDSFELVRRKGSGCDCDCACNNYYLNLDSTSPVLPSTSVSTPTARFRARSKRSKSDLVQLFIPPPPAQCGCACDRCACKAQVRIGGGDGREGDGADAVRRRPRKLQKQRKSSVSSIGSTNSSDRITIGNPAAASPASTHTLRSPSPSAAWKSRPTNLPFSAPNILANLQSPQFQTSIQNLSQTISINSSRISEGVLQISDDLVGKFGRFWNTGMVDDDKGGWQRRDVGPQEAFLLGGGGARSKVASKDPSDQSSRRVQSEF